MDMVNLFYRVRVRLQKDIERERRLDGPIGAISRKLWPYPESKLILYVIIAAILDYTSTFTALELSSNQVYEAGLVAKWALKTGGFPGLFLMDIASVSTLIFMAVGARYLYRRLSLNGFARAASVLPIIPYFVVTMGVVFNNVLVTLL
jgi:hypothetical protein